jgi:hypothetical protein
MRLPAGKQYIEEMSEDLRGACSAYPSKFLASVSPKRHFFFIFLARRRFCFTVLYVGFKLSRLYRRRKTLLKNFLQIRSCTRKLSNHIWHVNFKLSLFTFISATAAPESWLSTSFSLYTFYDSH